MSKITGKSIIGKTVREHPNTLKVFEKYGWGCLHCPVAGSETIEQGALAHGLDELKLEKMLHELNKAIVSKAKRK